MWCGDDAISTAHAMRVCLSWDNTNEIPMVPMWWCTTIHAGRCTQYVTINQPAAMKQLILIAAQWSYICFYECGSWCNAGFIWMMWSSACLNCSPWQQRPSKPHRCVCLSMDSAWHDVTFPLIPWLKPILSMTHFINFKAHANVTVHVPQITNLCPLVCNLKCRWLTHS